MFHYSSSLCGYCVPPRSAGWLKLEADLARAGCRSVVIAPNGSDFPLDGDTTPHRLLTTVPLPFAAATRFAATPTTAVIAAEGVVVWMQVGASAASDAPAALRNLAVYRRAGRAGLWAEWLLQR